MISEKHVITYPYPYIDQALVINKTLYQYVNR